MTFTVDMSGVHVVSGEGSHPAVFVVWEDNGPTGLEMKNNRDGTWSLTTKIVIGTHTYKFRNGKHSTWFGGWENVPEECSHGEYNTRQMDVDEHSSWLAPVCFGCCGNDNSISKYQLIDRLRSHNRTLKKY